MQASKILLTGASGFLGRHILCRLQNLGHDVVVVGRSRPTQGFDGDWRAVDLLDTPNLQAALRGLGASHLLHLAWYTEHGRYWSSSENLRWVDASLRLLQAFAAQGGRHALLAGSCAEYDWSHGWLRSWGLAPVEQSEPQRMAQQIRPETLRILRARETPPVAPSVASEAPAFAPPAPAPAAMAASAPATVCLQAGTLDQRQADAVRTAAAALPQGSWSLESTPIPGRWMVYMGRFADDEALDKKRAELRARKVPFDRPNNPTLEPGLSLGRFSSEEAAQRALTDLGRKGVRTARVVQERRDTPAYLLRLPNADAALRQQVRGLRGALAGKELRGCE